MRGFTRKQAILSAALLIACGGGSGSGDIDPIDPSDPIDPPEARCDGNALQVWVDGRDYSPATEVTSSSSSLSTSVSSQAEVGVPFHAVHFFFDGPGAIDSRSLPAAGVRVDFSLNPNAAFEPPPSVYVTTGQPFAVNWSRAEVDGELQFAETGFATGEPRCGSFDAVLTWQVEDFDYEARVRGRFAGNVEPPDDQLRD
jgi:hypothetical protein